MFPERMLALMKAQKITKKKLSDDLNIGINQIKYWETNNNIPSADVIFKIAKYLNTTAEYLLEESDTSMTPPSSERARLLQEIEECIHAMDDGTLKQLLDYSRFLLNRRL